MTKGVLQFRMKKLYSCSVTADRLGGGWHPDYSQTERFTEYFDPKEDVKAAICRYFHMRFYPVCRVINVHFEEITLDSSQECVIVPS